MPRAVRFDHYGGIDVLDVVEVPRPAPGDGELLVAVRAAGINPGEAKIREGLLHDMFPATFPSGEGSDLAGVVEEVGPGVSEFAPGDEVIGFTDNRASHAELVLVRGGERGRATARGPVGSRRAHCSWREPPPTRWSAPSRPAPRTSSRSPERPAASARSPFSSPSALGPR